MPIAADGVGTCEKLLEQAGVLERLEAIENMAAVRIKGNLSTLVELLPPQAKVKRRVMRQVERFVGNQRDAWVYFPPRELAAACRNGVAGAGPHAARTGGARGVRLRARLSRPGDSHARPLPPLRQPGDRLRNQRAAQSRPNTNGSTPCCATARRVLAGRGRFCAISAKPRRSIAGTATIAARPRPLARPRRAAAANQAGVLDAVRIVLSGVARTRGRCGKQLLAQMLCGSNSEKVTRMGFNKLSTYGLLAHLRQTEAVDLIDALVAVRYIEQVDVDRFRPVLQLTADGQAVMAGRVDSLPTLSLATGLVEKLCRAARCRTGAATPASHAPKSGGRKPGRSPRSIRVRCVADRAAAQPRVAGARSRRRCSGGGSRRGRAPRVAPASRGSAEPLLDLAAVGGRLCAGRKCGDSRIQCRRGAGPRLARGRLRVAGSSRVVFVARPDRPARKTDRRRASRADSSLARSVACRDPL